MQTTRFFQDLLGLTVPWSVQRVAVSPKEKKVDVWLAHRRPFLFPCPECGAQLPVYDHTAPRSWRHLDSGGFLTWVHARVPRVRCLFHGRRQVLIPWALEHARFTTAFESWAIDVLRESDVQGATRLLRLSWDEAWGIMERAVARGRRAKRRRVIPHLGVDEKAIAKGHRYVTLVNDLARGTVEYVGFDRKQESLEKYYRSLSEKQLAGLEAIAMDRWDPYIAATKAYVPQAEQKIVFDRYHLMKYMNEAVDKVRREEQQVLLAQGNRILVGTKHLWLYAEENLPEAMTEWLAALRGLHLKTGRSWAIKESLRDLWDYQYRSWAERHWEHWYFWATHSRLPPVIEAAKTLQRHLPNILTYFEHRITNAASEGINSMLETLKKTPMGFGIGLIGRWPSTFTLGA